MFVLGSTLQNVAILPIFREETWASLLNRRNISFIFFASYRFELSSFSNILY